MNTHSLKAYEAKFGAASMERRVGDMLLEADGLLGGGTDVNVLKTMSRLLLDDFSSRTAGCFIMAIKAGVKKQTIGHKLTYPILCEWMYDQDKRVEEHNFNEYLSHK